MTRLLILLLTGLEFSACSTVPRPDTNVGVVNAGFHQVKGYNLSTDYDDNGNLNPSAKPFIHPANSVSDLDKNVCTDPQGWANLKAYIRMLRDEINSHLKSP